jgi:beta-aspartyl-peptidase (threonine type)
MRFFQETLFLVAILLISQVKASSLQKPSEAAQTGSARTREEAVQGHAGAEQQIKHLLVSQVEAWNRGDLEGFMNGYWRSPDLTFFSGGSVTKGWEQTLSRYKQRYQSQGREMGSLEFQNLQIDVLSDRSAIASGTWRLTMNDGTKPHGLFTLVLKRMPVGWRIVHDHTSAE